MELLGVILAGGAGRRMGGRDKGLLARSADSSIISHLVLEMTAAGLEKIVLVTNTPQPYRGVGLKILPDSRPGNGPLGGIEAGLAYAASRAEGVLFLPCDMPAISRVEIARLRRAWSASPGGVTAAVLCCDHEPYVQNHPLCCVVSAGHLPAVSRAIDEGKLKIRWLWEDLQATNVHFSNAEAFRNLNTTEELRAWQANT